MKKDKLYLIISILFVAVSIVLTNGFKGTYSAVRVGDLGGEGDLYWGVLGSNCSSKESVCSFRISNNPMSYSYYAFGRFDSNKKYSGSMPWYEYSKSIKFIYIGSGDDIIKPKYINNWFNDFKYASIINLEHLDTSEVTDMSYMFYNVGSENGYAPSINDLDKINTSNVTNMSHMFENFGYDGCQIGDLNNWDVSNVTDMSYMFYHSAYNGKKFILDISKWNVSKVTNMSHMFEHTGNNNYAETWEIGDLSNWDVSSVQNMSYMFQDAGYGNNIKIWNIGDLSKWNVSNVTDMSHMFEYAGYGNNIKTWDIGDLGKWDVSKVTNMSYMFSDAGHGYYGQTWKIGDLSNWNVSNVTDMSHMFEHAGYYADTWEIGDLGKWDVSKVTDMSSMFSGAGVNSQTWEIGDLSNWDVSSVQNMSYMFQDAGFNFVQTWDIGDLNNWNVSNVTDMSYMFEYAGINAQTWNIGNLGDWDVSSVIDISGLFSKIQFIEELDLSSWNTSNVENYSNLFVDSRIKKVKVGDDWNLPLSDELWINEDTLEEYEDGNIPMNVSATYIRPIVYWAVNSRTLTISNHYIHGNVDYGVLNTMMNVYDQSSWIYDFYNGIDFPYKDIISDVRIGGPDDIIKPFNIINWFSSLYKVKKIDLTYLDTSNVVDMSYAFSTGYCENWEDDSTCLSSLTKIIGIDKLNTSNVIYMNGTFGYNMSLKEIDISNLDTSNVESMYELFAYDFELETIKGLNKLDIGNSYDIDWLFYKCKKLKELDLSSFDTSNVEYIYGMFGDDVSLDSITGIENFDLTKVNDLSGIFYNCKHLTELDLSGWNTSNIEYIDDMFTNTNMLSKVKVGVDWNLPLNDNTWKNIETGESYENGEIPENVEATYVITNDQFYWMIDEDILKVSNILDKNIKTYGKFDKDKSFVDYSPKESIPWFKYVNQIKKVEFGSEDDILHPINIDGWFALLNNVKEIDVRYIDTSDVTSMVYTFSTINCDEDTDVCYSLLKKIKGLENFDTSKVENFNGMFDGNIMLEELDLSSFDTSNENYCSNFEDEETKNDCQRNMFGELSSLKEIKVGNKFDFVLPYSRWKNKETSESYEEGIIPKNIAATYVRDMYYWAVKNDTLTISNNEITGIIDNGMFSEYSYYDKPWYKYYKEIKNVIVGDSNNIVKPTYIDGWFANLPYLENVDVTNFDTSVLETAEELYSNSDNIKKIIVGDKWDLPLTEDDWYNEETDEMYENGEIPANTAATYIRPIIYYIANEYECMNTNKCNGIISNYPIYDENMINFPVNTLYPIIEQLPLEDIGSLVKNIQVGGPDDIIKPYNMNGMFAYLSNIKEIDLQYLDTSNSIDMSGLFFNDYSLESIDVSNFDTSKVESMEVMFAVTEKCDDSGCTFGSDSLKEIKGLENFDTSNVTDMSGMFVGQGGIETVDVSSFDTSKVESMSEMFSCANTGETEEDINSNLKEIKGLENFDTTNVENYMNMFSGDIKLQELDLSGFNTSNENFCSLLDNEEEKNECYSSMFMYNDSLSKVKVNKNWNLPLIHDIWINEETEDAYEEGLIPQNVSATYIRPIIFWAIDDNTLKISNSYIEGNTAYGSMNSSIYIYSQNSWQYDYENDNEYPYNDIIKEVQIGGKDDIIKPYDMSEWFATLYKIQELDLSYLDTSNTSSMSYAFSTGYCTNWEDDSTCSSALTSIIGLDKLNTSNVIYMDGTFGYNMSLKEIDISSIDTSQVGTMSELFSYNFELENIVGLDKLVTNSSYDLSRMFYKCKKLKEIDLSNFDISNVTHMLYMFSDDTSLESIKGIENFDLSKTNDLSEMFYNCRRLTELDLSGWDTSNIEDIDGMFTNTNMLNKVKVGTNWNLPLSDNTWKNIETGASYEYGEIPENVAATYVKTDEQFYWMIDGDTLKVSNTLDTNTNDYGAFDKDKSFIGYSREEEELIPWYEYINQIKKVEFGSEEDILHPTNIYGWFAGLSNVEEIDVSYIDTSDVTSMVGTFSTMNCDEDTDVCYSSLKKIKGLENFDTSKVENFNGMFYGNIMLEELDLSSFDTSVETYCSNFGDEETRNNCQRNMFGELSSLKEIKVGDKFDFVLPYSTWTNKETNISYEYGIIPKNVAATYSQDMYYWAVNDDTLIISNNEVTGSTDNGMFSEFSYYNKPWYKYYKEIKNVIVGENNNIVKPAFMVGWFANLPYLENVDVTNVDTSILENAEDIYYNSNNIKKFIVGDKWNLTLSSDSWLNEATNNIYWYNEIPQNTAATYVRNLIYWAINDDTLIFSNYFIIGNIDYGIYNTISDVSYEVRFDSYGGYNIYSNNLTANPWYDYSDIIKHVIIGNENDVIKPYNMNGMFSNLINIKEIDLQYLDTSNAIDMGNLFSNDYSLESIDLSNFNTSNTINLSFMFAYCDSLKNITDLNKFNVENVISTAAMFYGCSNLLSVDFGNWNTKSLKDMHGMFIWNEELLEIKGIENFDTSKVIFAYSLFYDCINLVELDLSNWDTSNFEYYNNFFGYIDNLSKIIVGEKWDLYLTNETWINEGSGNIYDNGAIPENVAATYIKPIVYWAINNDTLTISNNEIAGNIDYGKFYSVDSFILDIDNPWSKYKNRIKNVIIGNENDIIKPFNMDEWFKDLNLVKELDLSYVDINFLDSANNLFNNMISLEKINMRNFDLRNLYNNNSVNDLNIFKNVTRSLASPDLFLNNNNLKEISVGVNNISIVKESLKNPSSEYITGATGVWYDVDGKSYDVSELPEDKDAIYYALKPHKVSYNADGVESQAKFVDVDLTLYDEVIKESDTTEIITKFDTVGGSTIEDVTSLKITTYTLKNFTDKDKNIYLPGSIYTKDEDLELTVNYDEEVHYNSIELPIPVKHGYKFEYWTLDGKKIDEYTPKSNKTLVAVFSEIKYNFVDNEIEYEKEKTEVVIFEIDGIIENFKNLYVNGKRFELGKDYVINENKIILTNDGIEYLDSLEPGEYEVRAEFSDSNSDVYGIIKISEKEVVPEEEPKKEPEEEPQDNPITPKTSDYILFTVIIALTALISSILVYKKIE